MAYVVNFTTPNFGINHPLPWAYFCNSISKVNVKSPVAKAVLGKYPLAASSKICKLLFVIVPQRPAFSASSLVYFTVYEL